LTKYSRDDRNAHIQLLKVNSKHGRQAMKVTCDACGCHMKITSSFRYLCPECRNEIEMAHIQETNQKYREEQKKNIEWLRIKGNEIIIAE
jgi:hypothetical protein